VEANILTVLAILVAGYTLLVEKKRIDLRLRLSWIDKLIFIFLAICILYVIYLPVLKQIGLTLPLPWLWGFNENLVTFTCIVVILIYLMVKLAGHHLPKSKVSDWGVVSEQLLRVHKFEELAFLLDRYQAQIINVNKDRWYDKVRLKLLAPYHISIREQISGSDLKQEHDKFSLKIKTFIINVFKPLAFFLSKCLPDSTSYKDVLLDSTFKLLKSKQFVKHLTQTHPLLCAKFTVINFRSNDEFINSFFLELIENTSSSLYRELRDNQNCSYTGEYYIDESNQLLDFYFGNIQNASNTSVWNPIERYTTAFIRKQKGQDNYYNQPYSFTYYEEDKWSCPIYMSIFFFNIMVSRAIFTNHNEHMWLMFVKNFIKEILDNYEPHPNIVSGAEFPTRFDYLIYSALSTCIDWVGSVEYSDSSKMQNKDEARAYPEYSAAVTLGDILKLLLDTKKITTTQQVYYLEMVVTLLNKLDNNGNQFFSKIILDNTVRNYEYDKPNKDRVKKLWSYYQDIDHVLRKKNSTFGQEIKKNYLIHK